MNFRYGMIAFGSVALVALAAYADTKISQMPPASALAGGELIPVVQGGTNAVTTPNQIKQFIGSIGTVTSVATSCGLAGGPVTGSGTVKSSEGVNIQTGTSYSLGAGDCGKLVTQSNAGASTFILLAPIVAGNGYWFDVVNYGVGNLTLSPAAGNINNTTSIILTSGQGAHVVTDGSNYFANLGAGAGGTGGGTVTSVALSAPGIFSISGSPVVNAGTLSFALVNQNPNLVWAGPASGGAGAPLFRSLVGADLPLPTATSLGGVQSKAATSHQFLTGISTSGVPSSGQPACGDLADSGTACNVTMGTSGHVGTFADGNNIISGNNTYSGISTFTGAIKVPMRVIVSGNVTVSASTDNFICIKKTTGSATTVTLPSSPIVGQTFLIKDCKGDAATNNITVTPVGVNIDGAATYVLNTNHQSISATYDGAQWEVN